MSDELQQMNEVRSCFGLVIYNSQLLEQQLIFMLIAADLHIKYKFDPQKLKLMFGNKFNQTIQKYLPELRVIYRLDNETITYIKQSLDSRNTFTFRYFGKRTKEIFSTEGRKVIIKELEKVSLLLVQTNNLLKEQFNFYLKDKRMFKVQVIQIVNQLFRTT